LATEILGAGVLVTFGPLDAVDANFASVTELAESTPLVDFIAFTGCRNFCVASLKADPALVIFFNTADIVLCGRETKVDPCTAAGLPPPFVAAEYGI
jgi:hypothetical protein